MIPSYIILHTLAFSGSAGVAEVTVWHKKRNFRTVGYHYIIRRDGRLETGRREHETGAHCVEMGMNRQSLGIAFEGHGNYERWTDEQWSTLRRTFSFLSLKYDIPPDRVLGHRETGAKKTCPGELIDMVVVRMSLRRTIQTRLMI